MRLDDEIDKQTYKDKRDEMNLKKSRLESEKKAHGGADDGFNEIVLDLFDLVNHVGDAFSMGKSIENKQLLLHFIFKKLVLKEGNVGYELNPPFCYMEIDTDFKSGGGSCEPSGHTGFSTDSVENSGLQKMTSANREKCCKNNGLQSKLQPVFSLAALAGQSSNDIITRLRAHRAEVLAIKEQLDFVRQKFAA